jgi:hypothetical protein
MTWKQPVHFVRLSMVWKQSVHHDLGRSSMAAGWPGCNHQAISVLLVVWFIRAISVQVFSLHGHTALHYDGSIIADLFETKDDQHVLIGGVSSTS